MELGSPPCVNDICRGASQYFHLSGKTGFSFDWKRGCDHAVEKWQMDVNESKLIVV